MIYIIILIVILTYIIGCVLSYGRYVAAFTYGNYSLSYQLLISTTLMSWLGFFAGVCDYYVEKDGSRFLKFNTKQYK